MQRLGGSLALPVWKLTLEKGVLPNVPHHRHTRQLGVVTKAIARLITDGSIDPANHSKFPLLESLSMAGPL